MNQQERREQDLLLLTQAQARTQELLAQTPHYTVRHAQRILRAAKQLEQLAKELENQ